MVQPGWLAAFAVIAAGAGWATLTHAIGVPYGLIFGPILVAIGVGLGAGLAGVPAHWVAVIIGVLAVLGILVDFYGIFGPSWFFI